MALTKKHLAIQEAKILIRDQIEAECLAGKEAIKRVPDFVLCGKQQTAVMWKTLAEYFLDIPCPRGPVRATTEQLKNLLAWRHDAVLRLCGKKPML